MDTTETKKIVRKPAKCTYCKKDILELRQGASCPYCGSVIIDPRRTHVEDPRKAQPQ